MSSALATAAPRALLSRARSGAAYPSRPALSRAYLCPQPLRCRQWQAQILRLPRRAAAAPVAAVLAAPALLAVSKAVACGLSVAWASTTLRSFWASMEELFNFSPHRLQLQYLPGTGQTGPLEARRYTLTHCDRSGMLQLSIGREWHKEQFSGWYKRFMRDEVLAEWRGAAAAAIINASAGHLPAPAALPSLHIYCHVSEAWEVAKVAGAVARLHWPPAPPRLRAAVFEKDLPLVLAALAYAERSLLQSSPLLAAAPVYMHFRSHLPELNRVVLWGRFGDPASWGPQAVVAQPPTVVVAPAPKAAANNIVPGPRRVAARAPAKQHK